MLVLLMWIDRGLATMEAAERKGRHGKPSWGQALRGGLFTISPSGQLKLTTQGEAWLSEHRASA